MMDNIIYNELMSILAKKKKGVDVNQNLFVINLT